MGFDTSLGYRKLATTTMDTANKHLTQIKVQDKKILVNGHVIIKCSMPLSTCLHRPHQLGSLIFFFEASEEPPMYETYFLISAIRIFYFLEGHLNF